MFAALLVTSTVAVAYSAETEIVAVTNPSFEDTAGGWGAAGEWTRSTTWTWASPKGDAYGVVSESGKPLTQTLGSKFEANKTYTLTAWVRALTPRGPPLKTVAKLTIGGKTTTVDVSPPKMFDANCKPIVGDDGANVYIEGSYRIHMSEKIYSQKLTDDPIKDPWTKHECDTDACDGMAHAPILNKHGLKATYGTWYNDEKPIWSRIDLIKYSSSDNTPFNIKFPAATGNLDDEPYFDVLIKHNGDETPWVMDAHMYHDEDTDKLWMTWGGYQAWITEMDPKTGYIKALGPTSATGYNAAFTSHAAGIHFRVLSQRNWAGAGNYPAPTGANENAPASWKGDELDPESSYMEGPSLYKANGYWYACGSYGSMGWSYTIRCCRRSATGNADPTGEFVDKTGVGCTKFDAKNHGGKFGNSMLLADDGDQLVPGHPHMWKEVDSGTKEVKHYLGYDYRSYQKGKERNSLEENSLTSPDAGAIRRLYFVDGWPTIWTPVSISVTTAGDSSSSPSLVGKDIVISLGVDDGSSNGAVVGFDGVEVVASTPAAPAPSPAPQAPAEGPSTCSPTQVTADDGDHGPNAASTAARSVAPAVAIAFFTVIFLTEDYCVGISAE